ncbi:MAG: ABC transporter ATP-binding protein [Gudongella sp.]|nr:ABC transporter ATP-binding protein [Gudongella sp.]
MSNRLLEVNNLRKYFKVKNGNLHAVDDINFYINTGETLGLVGESGCGKSTTGRALVRLLEADNGEIIFNGDDVLKKGRKEMSDFRQSVQMVFQDPYSCLNPRLSIGNTIAEPLEVNKVYKNRKARQERVRELMSIVGIEDRLINSYPHELDGGMRQRVGIARALAINPKFIVLDEPVSSLDVCIQAQILNLLKRLQNELDLTYLFISHDLSVVKYISDRIAVMYLGKIVELSDHNAIFKDPLHPYTQALLSAIPVPKLDGNAERIILKGDVPSPVNPPQGCRFYTRCIYAKELCSKETPELREVEPERFVACHFAKNLSRTVN